MQHFNSSNSSLNTQVSPGVVAASSVLVICFCLGVPGNIVVMVRLSGWLKENSFTPRLMLSLAVSDLLTLLTLPLWIWSLLKGWISTLFPCKINAYVMYTSIYCSTLCVVLLSVQRYVQVLHTQTWNKFGGRRQKILLIGLWMLSGVLASYALVQHCVKQNGECGTCYQNDREAVATLLLEVLILMLSIILLAYFYFQLYQGVNRSAFSRSQTLTKLVRRIVVTYFICWIPYIITNIMLIFDLLLRDDSLMTLTKNLRKITQALVFINSCVNPFFYALSVRALRQQPAETENY